MSLIAAEDALVTQVRAVLGNSVRTVESLPSDWDDEMLSRLLRVVPGAYVAFAGGPVGQAAGNELVVDARWVVYVATGHASGEAARRRGDTLQAGAYELLEVLAPQLHGFEIPDIGTCWATEVLNLYTGTVDKKGVAVYGIALKLELPFARSNAGIENLARFETFAAQYDVPPHDSATEHAKWLAGEITYTAPDAQDQVTLPE